jgi:hypothetical protein
MTRDEIATAILSGMAAGHLGLSLTRANVERAVQVADTLIEVLNETKNSTSPARTLPKEPHV